MATLKIQKGTIHINQTVNTHEEPLSMIFYIIGLIVIFGGFVVACSTKSSKEESSGDFFIPMVVTTTIVGLLYIALARILVYLCHIATTQYECSIEELEGSIDDIEVNVKSPIKIDGMVEADLKKISIPKSAPSKTESKSATDPESKA